MMLGYRKPRNWRTATPIDIPRYSRTSLGRDACATTSAYVAAAVLLSARRREVGVGGELLLTKAEQVSVDGVRWPRPAAIGSPGQMPQLAILQKPMLEFAGGWIPPFV